MLEVLKNIQKKKLQAFYKTHPLVFKKPSGTSRGILTEKKSWFIVVSEAENKNISGIGECGLLQGLSCDDVPEYENVLQQVCADINNYEFWLNAGLKNFPSIRFGLEMALLDFSHEGKRILFPSEFTAGKASIRINGLIWMGGKQEMKTQMEQKLSEGFTCLKLKIGAIDFEEELELLQFIRSNFSPTQLEIRVDANGAFTPESALEKLQLLSAFQLHSIEQPIAAGQWEAMAELCEQTPLPIALDEELIGISEVESKEKLLLNIQPQYIILKPSLVGGFEAAQEWINIAGKHQTGWWITSALESNIGLNAIAQWTFTLNNPLPQGLGTGQLYTNNFSSPLELKGEWLSFNNKEWMINFE